MTSNIVNSPTDGTKIDLTTPDYYRAAKVRLSQRNKK